MSFNKISKEFHALFNCLYLICSKHKAYQFTQLYQESINWNKFIQLVRWHKVTPVVYKVLNEYYKDCIPSTVINALKTYRDKNTIHVMKLTSELVRIAKLFQDEGIPFISLKGPLLAQKIYGDMTLREPKDLDLLIPEEYLAITHQLLSKHGYHLSVPRSYPNYLPLYMRYQKDLIYFHPTKQIIVELHWRFFNNQYEFLYPTKQLFHLSERESFFGLSFVKMPIDLELIYLLYHGTTHLWSRVCWLHDIRQYLNYMDTSPNWSYILDTATQIGAERAFLTGLVLTEQLFRVDIDPIISRNAQQNKSVQSLIKKSHCVLMQSKFPTKLMRLKMLKARFRLRTPSLAYNKEFIMRLLLRALRIIR